MTTPNIISSRAEYRRDHYFFPRTQSPAVRNTPWASRRYAVDANDRDEPWGVALAAAAGLVLLIAAMIMGMW